MRLALLALVAFAGCVPAETSYYLTDIAHTRSGTRVAERCGVDADGHATTCELVKLEDDLVVTPATDPATPESPRPAPDAAAVARAIMESGAERLVEQCHAAYPSPIAGFDVGLAIAPSGEITQLELHDADGPFGDCAAKALRTTSIPAFDGAPIRVTEHVRLQVPAAMATPVARPVAVMSQG